MDQVRLAFHGIDGVGKTTLAKYTAEKLGGVYYKDTIFKELFFGQYDYCYHSSFALAQYFEGSKERIIIDRWFWDEFVYGTVLQRRLNMPYLNRLDSMAYRLGFKIVYLEKTNPRPDEIFDKAFHPMLKAAYEELFKRTACQVIRINTDDEHTENQFKRIVEQLNLIP